MGDVDLKARLSAGHLGLASRRLRIEAAGGTIRFGPAEPRGTAVEVRLPHIARPGPVGAPTAS